MFNKNVPLKIEWDETLRFNDFLKFSEKNFRSYYWVYVISVLKKRNKLRDKDFHIRILVDTTSYTTTSLTRVLDYLVLETFIPDPGI